MSKSTVLKIATLVVGFVVLIVYRSVIGEGLKIRGGVSPNADLGAVIVVTVFTFPVVSLAYILCDVAFGTFMSVQEFIYHLTAAVLHFFSGLFLMILSNTGGLGWRRGRNTGSVLATMLFINAFLYAYVAKITGMQRIRRRRDEIPEGQKLQGY